MWLIFSLGVDIRSVVRLVFLLLSVGVLGCYCGKRWIVRIFVVYSMWVRGRFVMRRGMGYGGCGILVVVVLYGLGCGSFWKIVFLVGKCIVSCVCL